MARPCQRHGEAPGLPVRKRLAAEVREAEHHRIAEIQGEPLRHGRGDVRQPRVAARHDDLAAGPARLIGIPREPQVGAEHPGPCPHVQVVAGAVGDEPDKTERGAAEGGHTAEERQRVGWGVTTRKRPWGFLWLAQFDDFTRVDA